MFYNRERLDKGISMSKVVPIRPDMAVPAKEMEAEADLVDLFAPGGFVTTLNSVHITGPQMRAAVETIAHIPVRSEADVAEPGQLLGLFASDYGFAPAAYAGMALPAPALALDLWRPPHEPFLP